MRAAWLILPFLAGASARAGDRLGVEAELSAGPVWSLKDRCRDPYTCSSPVGISVRAGYELLPFASVGLRADAALGSEGSGRLCGGPNCEGIAGYRAGSLLLDAQLHTMGSTQLVGGVAFGVGRLVRLQCNCSEDYDIHGSGLPVLEIALGVRTDVVPRTVHLGIEGRYSAMFNAETAGSTVFGPPVPQTGLTVSAISASFVMGVSL